VLDMVHDDATFHADRGISKEGVLRNGVSEESGRRQQDEEVG
jgi:hypothetical protein